MLRSSINRWSSVLFITGLYYSVLVILLLTVGMDEYVLGPAQWLPLRFAAGLILAAVPGIPLAVRGKQPTTPSTLFIVFQLAFVHIPSCAICAVHDNLPLWFILLTGMILLLMGSFVGRISKSLVLGYPLPLKVALAVPLILWVTYAIGVYLVAVVQSRFSIASVFNMDLLYSFRAEVFSSFSSRALTALGSLGYFLLPLLMIMAAINRKMLLLLFLFLSVIILYGVTGMKAYLAVPIFTVITFLMSQKFRMTAFFSRFLMLILLLLLTAGGVGYYLDSPWPLALFFRRGVMTPGELHIIYGDYFADTSPIPFWQILRKGTPDGGELTWAEIIAYEVFGGTVGQGEGANTGIIASAFAVYGFIGVALHSLAIVVVLALLDRFASRHNMPWISFAAIPSLFLLTNMELISNLLYYGLGFSIVTIICLSKRNRRFLQNSSMIQQA